MTDNADLVEAAIETPLQQAVWEIVRAAWCLLDDTANDNPPEVPQDSWDGLANAMEAVKAHIPDSEWPCEESVCVRLLVEETRRNSIAAVQARMASDGGQSASDEAADFCITTLARMLGSPDYEQCDGTEEWEGDVAGTIHNVLRAADVLDENHRIAKHLSTAPQPDPRDAEIARLRADAEKWRGLMACQRVRRMGWTNDGNHMGVEFWVKHSAAHPSEEYPQEADREGFEAFARAALAKEGK